MTHNYYGCRIIPLEDRPHHHPPKDETWRDKANCLGMSAELFFPPRGDTTAEAKAVCRGCSVRQSCLDYALTPPLENWGVWGGASDRERRRMRPRRETS